MYCIRDKKTELLMGLSYTMDGLKFVTNKTGRCILFKNAILKFNAGTNRLEVVGDLRLNKRFKIVPYEFIKHNDKFRNNVESWYRKVAREKSY